MGTKYRPLETEQLKHVPMNVLRQKNGWRLKSDKNHTQTINFMLQQDAVEKIRETARVMGISVSEYVRELIQRGIERAEENK